MKKEKKTKFSLEISAIENIWDKLSELEDFFHFENLSDLEDALGEIHLLTIPIDDAYNSDIHNWQFQAQWSENSKIYNKYFNYFGKPKDNEITIILYTEAWDYITDFTHSKDTLYLKCYDCQDSYTFEELQVFENEAYCETCFEYV